MEVENVAPLLGSNFVAANTTQKHCCNGACGGDAFAKTTSLPQSQGNKQGRMQRQSTSDSGFESSLDPISEHHEDGVEIRGEPGPEANSICSRKPSLPQTLCVGHCHHGGVAPNQGEAPCRHSLSFEETELNRNGTCRHSWKSPDFEMRKSYSSSCFLEEPLVAHNQCKRARTVSEGYTGSVSQQLDGALQIGKCGHSNFHYSKQMDIESAGNRKKVGKCRRYSCNITIFVMFTMILAGSVLAIYFISRSEMKRMEEEIGALKESIGKVAQTPPSFAEMRNARGEVRPGIHLVLKGGSAVHLDQQNRKVLQWIPHVDENQSFEYNEKTRSLTVSESGIYFVYNQIYVFRDVPRAKAAGAKNQTIFHTIFKKPFNYPSNLEPMKVSESALSNCWSKSARRQIHTSYQGVVVKLQRHEQLLVALEDYDESLDTLQPESTFFGAFKL